MNDTPWRVETDSSVLEHILGLLHHSFEYMHARIDPPSSLHRLTVAGMRAYCEAQGEIWAIGHPPVGCVFLTPRQECLYLGKLAVRPDLQGRGIGRALIAHAERRAVSLGLPALELETRVELTENHLMFLRLGFTVSGYGKHEGYDRPTDVKMRKTLSLSGDS